MLGNRQLQYEGINNFFFQIISLGEATRADKNLTVPVAQMK